MKTLQQRIVQVPRDARPLIDALFQTHIELLRQLPQPQLIKRSERCQKSGHTQRSKPNRLVVGRSNGEIQERPRLVPHAAVIAGDDAEAVLAWRKIGVERLPTIAGVLPIAIPAFQLVAKEHLFRRDQAERRIVDLQIAHQRR